MPKTQIGIKLTDVTSTPLEALGTLYEDDPGDGKGPRIYRYIQLTGSAGTVGELVERAATTTTATSVLGSATTTKATCDGVLIGSMAQNYYGFVQVYGPCSFQCDGSVTADADVVPAAAGDVTDFTAGAEHRVVGYAHATDAGAQTIVAGFINVL